MSFLTEKLEPQRLELFLAKPNKIVIGNLHHIKNERLKLKHGEVNELSFTLPYEVVMRNKLARNPHIDNIREKFFIKMKLGEIEEWFIITKLSKKAESTDDLDVQCFSLGYQLSYQRMIDYVGKSLNCLQVLTDCLKGTSWEVGYINPEFNLKHRQFDVSSKSKLEFLYEIAETFEGIVKFDTINSKINIYKEEEISQHKGFWIEEGKYLENIESITDADEIVTRLFVKGSDNLTINSVNPTGQSYVDDFSYFLSPFEMDEDGNIISHSDFMSDDLCIGIINYNKTASSLKGEFAKLLDEKKSIQLRKTEAENKLNQLNHELTLILDRLDVAKKLGENTSQIILERDRKQSEIKNQKQTIESINKSIESVDKKIDDLKHQLNIENHLSEKLLSELTNFIQVAEWSDDNQIDPNDLYEEALKHIKTVNSPPINMKIGLVNFLEMTTESHNWKRLNPGDIVKTKHKKLNIWVSAKIVEIEIDFENATIDTSISNVKEIETAKKKIERLFYTVDRVDTDYNARKTDWIKMTQNYNLRNDRIKEAPANPLSLSVSHQENDDGSVSLVANWAYPNYSETNKNKDNIDGFIVYLYSDIDDTPYIFGSRMANETIIPELHYDTRTYTFPSVPANKFYTVGVRAYRRVDPDIDIEEILFSDILSSGNPYQPKNTPNFKGKINGSNYSVAPEVDKPINPDKGDIWVNTDDAKIRVWNGEKWKVDNAYQDSKDYTDLIVGKTEEEIRKKVEEALKEVDEAMQRVDEEMERIENEVIPEIEQAIKDSHIPRQDSPPNPEDHKLWMDTSKEPPRFMQYDEEKSKWVSVAPTEDEINQIIEDMRNSVVQENRQYTEEEILAVKQTLLNQLYTEIGDVNSSISDLRTRAEGVDGTLITMHQDINRIDGSLTSTINQITNIDGVISEHTTTLQQYYDAIQAKAEKDEVYTRTQTDGLLGDKVDYTVYSNKMALLDIDIDGISNKVSNTETSIDSLTGELTNATSQIAQLNIRADGIVQSVSEVRADLDGLEIGGRNLLKDSKRNINTTTYDVASYNFSEPMVAGETYACSIMLKITNRTQRFALYNSGGTDGLSGWVSIPSDKQGVMSLFTFTFTGKEVGSNTFLRVYSGVNGETGRTEIEWIKLEKGNKATDWTPAPEDTDARITSTEASITTLAGQIELKASQISALDNRMTANESRIDLLPNEINLAVTQGIGRLNIGGTNLQTGTSNEFKSVSWSSWNVYPNGSTSSVYIPVAPGEEYTVRTYYRNVTGTALVGIRVLWRSSDGTIVQESPNGTGVAPGEEGYAQLTTKAPTGAVYATPVLRRYSNTGTSTAHYKDFKFEKGNKATDWSPAPEDQVDKTNVLSSINLSNEGVKIQGSKIDIAGLVTVLNADGTAGTLINGNKIVTGSLTANRLNVNEIFGNSAVIAKIQSDSVLTANLSATKITTGTLNAANVAIVNLSASSIISGTLDASKVNVANLNASNIKSGTLTAIDITGVNITGSRFVSQVSSTNYTLIEGGYLESRGRFVRTWLGSTKTHDIKMRFENGYLRARNDTEDHSLYYTDFGISTYADGSGPSDGASGTLAFRDTTYSTAQGVTLQSSSGVVALRSDNNRVVLDANNTVSIESSQYSIYFRPYRDSRAGTNDFRMWVKDNPSYNGTDGVLSYGTPSVGQSSGLRFTKSIGGERIIYATNGNGDKGTGAFHAPQMYANNIDTATDDADTILYIRSNKEIRATKRGTSGTNSVFVPVRASAFPTGSMAKYKQDIHEWTESALDKIKNTTIYEYRLKSEIEEGVDRLRQGLVIGSGYNTPSGLIDGDGIEQYLMNTWNMKAIQELSAIQENQEDEINYLKIEIQYLKQKIKLLENKIS